MARFSLTDEEYSAILKNKFNNPKINYKRAEVSPLSDNVEGLMGQHYNLKIYYELSNEECFETFFIKSNQSSNEQQEEMMQSFNVYHREIFIYDFLLREFEKMGFDASFSPRAYFNRPGEVIVMENLMDQGFYLTERQQYFDKQHLEAGLEAIASLHAYSMVYELEKSKELKRSYKLNEEFKDSFIEAFFRLEEDTYAHRWFETSKKLFNDLMDMSFYPEEIKTEFKKKLKEKKFREIFFAQTKHRKTVGHGDMWPNNIMFKKLENGKIKANLVDYQVLRYFFPAYDLLLFIYFNCERDYRKKHLDDLLKFYYKAAKNIFTQKGYDISSIFPMEELYETIPLIEFQAVLQVTSCYTVTFLPKYLFNSLVGEDYVSTMFTNRLPLVKKAVEEDATYKNTMNICLKELYEVLFK